MMNEHIAICETNRVDLPSNSITLLINGNITDNNYNQDENEVQCDKTILHHMVRETDKSKVMFVQYKKKNPSGERDVKFAAYYYWLHRFNSFARNVLNETKFNQNASQVLFLDSTSAADMLTLPKQMDSFIVFDYHTLKNLKMDRNLIKVVTSTRFLSNTVVLLCHTMQEVAPSVRSQASHWITRIVLNKGDSNGECDLECRKLYKDLSQMFAFHRTSSHPENKECFDNPTLFNNLFAFLSSEYQESQQKQEINEKEEVKQKHDIPFIAFRETRASSESKYLAVEYFTEFDRL